MRIGCHVSIAGGIEQSIISAENLGINTMQIFSKNSRTWKEKIYSPSEIDHFQKALQQTDISPVFIHNSYLINLASSDEVISARSITAFLAELERADALLANSGVPYLIVHPGAHQGAGEEYGLEMIIKALKVALKHLVSSNLSTIILLENTSGSGTNLGYSFSQLRYIMEGIRWSEKVGFCLDTCHTFAAGYNLSNEKGIEDTIAELDNKIGLERLIIIHLNDSKYSFNSRKDRHMPIGDGFIGLEGFKLLVNHPSLKGLPFILETPRQNDEDDRRNINLVKSLRE